MLSRKNQKNNFDSFTLKFINPEIETSFQESKIHLLDVPLIGKILIIGMALIVFIRRIEMHIDAEYGSKFYSTYDETRFTLEICLGTILEILVNCIKRLERLRGLFRKWEIC